MPSHTAEERKKARVKKMLSKKITRDPASIVESFRPTRANLKRAINKINKQIMKDLGKKDITKIAKEGQKLQNQLDALNS